VDLIFACGLFFITLGSRGIPRLLVWRF